MFTVREAYTLPRAIYQYLLSYIFAPNEFVVLLTKDRKVCVAVI
jgi:hypothetical protein